MEELLHYVWKHKIYPLTPLSTTDGQRVEVIDPGLSNPHAGPDFFNAKLRIDDEVWVGNVEVHHLASDWLRHGHTQDSSYDNVILHVVEVADAEVCCSNGRKVPQLVLPIPEEVSQRYEELLNRDAPEADETVALAAASSRLGRKTIELQHVSKRFGELCVLNDFSYR